VRALAKVQNYENPVFDLLFKELKHIILFTQLNQRAHTFKGLRTELAQLNIYLRHDTHQYKTFEQSGYKAILEEYEKEMKFNQRQINFRHNLHNKIA